MTYIYIYIYMYREREIERERDVCVCAYLTMIKDREHSEIASSRLHVPVLRGDLIL